MACDVSLHRVSLFLVGRNSGVGDWSHVGLADRSPILHRGIWGDDPLNPLFREENVCKTQCPDLAPASLGSKSPEQSPDAYLSDTQRKVKEEVKEPMEAKFEDGVLTLKGENNVERAFLGQAGIEGMRNFGRGSANMLSLPSHANLEQFHFNREEMKALIYAVGFGNAELSRIYGAVNVKKLTSKILGKK